MVHDFLGSTGSFFITSLISFFVILDPLGNIFPYLALTSRLPEAAARKAAARACFYSFLILALFSLAGQYILHFFSISLAAFQIAGGLILFWISLDMLQGRGHFNRLDTASSLKPEEYGDIALAPLAVPLLAGPGAITTALVLTSRALNTVQILSILLAAIIILIITCLCFVFSQRIMPLIKESGARLLTRLMALILAALAVQFIIEGVRSAFPSLIQ
ncbi:MAG: MarC family protein [Desulfobaccales bacterium]